LNNSEMLSICRVAEFRVKLVGLRSELENIEINMLIGTALKIADTGFLKVWNSIPEILTV